MSSSKKTGAILLAFLLSSAIPMLTDANEVIKLDSAPRKAEAQQDQRQWTQFNGHQQAPKSSLDRDDFHSNINLDDLIEYSPTVRYNLMGSSSSGGGDGEAQPLWLNNLLRNAQIQQRVSNRLSRSAFVPDPAAVALSNQADGFGRDNGASLAYQTLGSNNRQARSFDAMREDRDFTFASPHQRQLAASNQDLASRASLWASDLIGDLLRARQNQRAQQRRFHNLNQLSQTRGQNVNLASETNANEDSISGNREKRRRCKEDRNLGVKNPSFCDTDAYFGAADYSMRDVWDSAGR